MRRRTFLKSSAVAAGAALLEGCARRDEQWILSPYSRSGAAGESVWKVGTCGQCAAACGTRIRVVDADARKVEGLPGHPRSHGGLCALGQASLQGLYNPDRITAPQRDGETIAWEDALAAATEALGRDPSRLAILAGDSLGLGEALLRRFAAAIGAPAPTFLRAPNLAVETRAAELVLGFADLPAYDLAHSDYVVSLGPELLDRWNDPVWATAALTQSRFAHPGRRGKHVHVGARMSLTAAHADDWVPVRPGTEAIFARALGAALQSYGSASDAWSALCPEEAPEPARAAGLCGIDEATLRRLAAELSRAETPVVVAGGDAALRRNGLEATAVSLALNHLLGAVGREGGVFPPAVYGVGDALAAADEEPVAASTSLADLRQRLGSGGVSTLLLVDADPVHRRPASERWEEALRGVDTVIALTAFPDDSSRAASLRLPIQVDVERFNATEIAAAMSPVLSLSRPAVDAEGEARHPADILLALAASLDHAMPWETFSDAVLRSIDGPLADEIAASGVPSRGFFEAALDLGVVASPAKRSTLEAVAPKAPVGVAPAEPAGDGEMELLIFSSPKLGDGRGANRPWLQELPDTLSTVMWGSWAEIAAADARRLGIDTGDVVRIQGASGSVETTAVVTPAGRPGTVGVPLGLGHGDFGRYAAGRGINPLDLVGDERVTGCDEPCLGSIRVGLSRVGPGQAAIFGRGLRDAERIPTGWAPHIVTPEEEA